jgi:hypothetical protein
MLLDDLLSDEPAIRRLIGLLRRRLRPVADDAPLHESFVDQAALYEELCARLGHPAKAERREPTLTIPSAGLSAAASRRVSRN